MQLLAEYFEIGGRKNSCNYLDVSDKFGDNLGPNDLHNYSSSYRRILLDSAKKKNCGYTSRVADKSYFPFTEKLGNHILDQTIFLLQNAQIVRIAKRKKNCSAGSFQSKEEASSFKTISWF